MRKRSIRLSALSSSSSHPEWLNLDDIYRHHSATCPVPLMKHLTFNQGSCFGKLVCSTPCWRLVERGAIRCAWPPHVGQGIQQLLEILARHPSPQCPPPLPSMSHLRRRVWWPSSWLWRKWRQNHPPQCGQRCHFLSRSICSSRTIPRGPRFNPRIPVKTRWRLPPNLARWQARCLGGPCNFTAPANPHSWSCLLPWTRPRSWSQAHHPSTGLPLYRCKLHSHCGKNTIGGLSEETINIIGAIGNAIDWRVTMTHSTSSTKKHLFHHLAIALWRGNACLWLHRQQTLPPSADGIR